MRAEVYIVKPECTDMETVARFNPDLFEHNKCVNCSGYHVCRVIREHWSGRSI